MRDNEKIQLLKQKSPIASVQELCNQLERELIEIDDTEFSTAFWTLLGSNFLLANTVESEHVKYDALSDLVQGHLESLKKGRMESDYYLFHEFPLALRRLLLQASIERPVEEMTVEYDGFEIPTITRITDHPIVLSNGRRTPYFFDLDRIACNPKFAGIVSNLYVEKINTIKDDITKLCFVEKEIGPTGAALLLSSIVSKTGVDAVLYRHSRLLPIARIKGGELSRGDRLCVVDDVMDTGKTVANKADIISDTFDIDIPYAVVLYNYASGKETYTIDTKRGPLKVLNVLTYQKFSQEFFEKYFGLSAEELNVFRKKCTMDLREKYGLEVKDTDEPLRLFYALNEGLKRISKNRQK